METTTQENAEQKPKRAYVRRSVADRIAAKEAEIARLKTEETISDDEKAARKAARRLSTVADEVADAEIADMLREYSDAILAYFGDESDSEAA